MSTQRGTDVGSWPPARNGEQLSEYLRQIDGTLRAAVSKLEAIHITLVATLIDAETMRYETEREEAPAPKPDEQKIVQRKMAAGVGSERPRGQEIAATTSTHRPWAKFAAPIKNNKKQSRTEQPIEHIDKESSSEPLELQNTMEQKNEVPITSDRTASKGGETGAQGAVKTPARFCGTPEEIEKKEQELLKPAMAWFNRSLEKSIQLDMERQKRRQEEE